MVGFQGDGSWRNRREVPCAFVVEVTVLPCSERERHAAAVVVGCVYQPETGLGRF